ncbi:MAG: thioesterase family protein [Bacteroidota bacterium]
MPALTFEQTVHTFQVDFAGVLSNIIYIQWMEIGRTKLLEAAEMPVEALFDEGIVPVLVHTEIDYKRPYRLGDTASIVFWVSALRNASAQLDFRFYGPGGTLHASGRQAGLFVTLANMRPHRLGEAERARLAPYVLDEDPPAPGPN